MSSSVGSEERVNPAAGDLDAKDPGDLGAWNGNGPLGLWDSENCPIPTGHEPDILLIALRKYLESLGFDSNFKLLAVVGDVTDPDRIPKRHVDILTPLGVEFSSAPKDAEGKVPKDAANNVILKKLLRFNKSGARVPLIVVGGDKIYTTYLKNLVANNYDVVWIYPHSKTSTDTLLTLSPSARICYEDLMWTHMRLEHIRSGTGPTPTRGGLGGKRARKSEQKKKSKKRKKEEAEEGGWREGEMMEGRGEGGRGRGRGRGRGEEEGRGRGERMEVRGGRARRGKRQRMEVRGGRRGR